jgi:hypothetical protein
MPGYRFAEPAGQLHMGTDPSLKLDPPSAVARKNATAIIVLLVVVILGALIVVGQQGEPMTKKDIRVTDRFENAIKAKEPKFKLVSKHESKNPEQHYVLQGWKSDNDVVSATTYEFASTTESSVSQNTWQTRSVTRQIPRRTHLGLLKAIISG